MGSLAFSRRMMTGIAAAFVLASVSVCGSAQAQTPSDASAPAPPTPSVPDKTPAPAAPESNPSPYHATPSFPNDPRDSVTDIDVPQSSEDTPAPSPAGPVYQGIIFHHSQDFIDGQSYDASRYMSPRPMHWRSHRHASADAEDGLIEDTAPVSPDRDDIIAFIMREEGIGCVDDGSGGKSKYGLTQAYTRLSVGATCAMTPFDAHGYYVDLWNSLRLNSAPANIRLAAFTAGVMDGAGAAREIMDRANGDPGAIIKMTLAQKIFDYKDYNWAHQWIGHRERAVRTYGRGWVKRLSEIAYKSGTTFDGDMGPYSSYHYGGSSRDGDYGPGYSLHIDPSARFADDAGNASHADNAQNNWDYPGAGKSAADDASPHYSSVAGDILAGFERAIGDKIHSFFAAHPQQNTQLPPKKIVPMPKSQPSLTAEKLEWFGAGVLGLYGVGLLGMAVYELRKKPGQAATQPAVAQSLWDSVPARPVPAAGPWNPVPRASAPILPAAPGAPKASVAQREALLRFAHGDGAKTNIWRLKVPASESALQNMIGALRELMTEGKIPHKYVTIEGLGTILPMPPASRRTPVANGALAPAV